jgi:hypothetical protein
MLLPPNFPTPGGNFGGHSSSLRGEREAKPQAASSRSGVLGVLHADAPSEWTFDDGTETLALVGPIRLGTLDETSSDVRLCYRTRAPVAQPTAVWVTSAAGNERVELGAADEICLPSALASPE